MSLMSLRGGPAGIIALQSTIHVLQAVVVSRGLWSTVSQPMHDVVAPDCYCSAPALPAGGEQRAHASWPATSHRHHLDHVAPATWRVRHLQHAALSSAVALQRESAALSDGFAAASPVAPLAPAAAAAPRFATPQWRAAARPPPAPVKPPAPAGCFLLRAAPTHANRSRRVGLMASSHGGEEGGGVHLYAKQAD